MDATYILYTGLSTTNIPITPGQDLQTILQHIDTSIGTHSSAPDYSGYNLYCVTQTDGSSHPTNTQNFAEGISKILCDLKTSYNNFTGTTYVSDKSVFTTAITNLQSPGYTFSPFSITNADGINTVWSKTFTGISGMISQSNPSGASWSSISVSPSPTTVSAAFNDIITYITTLSTSVSGKQATLPTFNNSSNCLSGGATDSISTTVTLLTSYICTLPSYSSGSITWGCVSSSSTLNGALNNIISELGSIATGYVSTAGTGLTTTSLGTCLGSSVAIDTTWTGLYKVSVSSSQASAGNHNYLVNLIESTDSSVTIDNSTDPTKIDLRVTTPMNNKVKVTSSGTADYLFNKVPSTGGNWGLALTSSVSSDQLILTPTINNPDLFIQNFITYLSQDADMLTQFCALLKQCDGCQCAAPTRFTVVVTTV